MASDELRFPIGIPVATNAGETANEVDTLRDRIANSKLAVQAMAATMRNLTSKSEEAVAAKQKLKDVVAAEKVAIEQASLKLIKMGTTYDAQLEKEKAYQRALAKRKKEMQDQARGFGSSMSAVGGPLGQLHGRLESLKSVLSGAGGGMGLAAVGAAGLAAAIVALTAVVVAGTLAFARWVAKGADAARSMRLVREAATGSAKNAEALGMHVDGLARRVPMATENLNELAASLARSRLSGSTLVDTLNAVSQASAANGDAAGAKLRELVERGKVTRRMYLGLRELDGTGLHFDDVAKALAKATGKGVKEARAALLSGRVSLASGAEALRKAAEEKFGEINLAKKDSLPELAQTMRQHLGAMTADVKLEPMIRGLKEIISFFDTSTSTGYVLKEIVTGIGNAMSSGVEKGAPLAKQFLRGMLVSGLKLYIVYLQLRNALRKTFGDSQTKSQINWLNVALNIGKVATGVLAANLLMIGVAVAAIAAPIVLTVSAFVRLRKAVLEGYEKIKSIDWAKLGSAIIDGFLGGLRRGYEKVKGAVKTLGQIVKKSFSGELEIASPSKVFDRYAGKDIPAGFERGGERAEGDIRAATERMAEAALPPAPSVGSGGAGSSAAAAPLPPIQVIINAQGASKEAVAVMTEKSFLEGITAALLDALASRALAVQR